MKIGIICACDSEIAPFLPHIAHCKESEKAMLKIYEGSIHGIPIVTLFSGVGRVNAAIAAQILIDVYHADLLINAGAAGGMDARLHIFDTVISTESAYHDLGKDILTEFHPWMPSVFFPADAMLLKLSKNVAEKPDMPHRIFFGRMVTGEAFIADEGRDEINRRFAPLCVDMETAGIAHVCYANQIPFIAIRTITDTADHSGEANFELNCASACEIAKEITLAHLDEINLHYGI